MERRILPKEIEQIYAGKYKIMEGVGAPELEIMAGGKKERDNVKSNAKFTPTRCEMASDRIGRTGRLDKPGTAITFI